MGHILNIYIHDETGLVYDIEGKTIENWKTG